MGDQVSPKGRSDHNEMVYRVVQQATSGGERHHITGEDPIHHLDGSASYVIRCSCSAVLQGDGPSLAAAKAPAQRIWQKHAV